MPAAGPTPNASRTEWLRALALLAVFVIVIRGWSFGNPVVHIDEEFYLFGGQRILSGELPFIDFWDRKPFGLFLLYAPAHAFPDPVIGYQVMAALAVTLTAWVVFIMCRPLAGFAAALAAAAAYAAWLPLFGGIGGQTPVFYNLPMAAAAVLTLRRISRDDTAGLTRGGCAIMLLAGVAMQIKYSAVFEGAFFGLSLLWAGWSHGRARLRLAADAALWIAVALAPTLCVWGFYASLGFGPQFVEANFLSVLTDKVPMAIALPGLVWQSLALAPFWLCGWAVWRHWRQPGCPGRREAIWFLAWSAVAYAGYLVLGKWSDHYILPLLLPFGAMTALAFDTLPKRRAVMALVVGVGLAAGLARAVFDRGEWGNRTEAMQLAALVERHLGHGCLYVTDDIPILYVLTRACYPTAYIYPDHLILARYTPALGVDQAEEMRKTLARRPSVIVFYNDPDSAYAPQARGILNREIAADYRLAGTVKVGAKPFQVFARKDSGPERGAVDGAR